MPPGEDPNIPCEAVRVRSRTNNGEWDAESVVMEMCENAECVSFETAYRFKVGTCA